MTTPGGAAPFFLLPPKLARPFRLLPGPPAFPAPDVEEHTGVSLLEVASERTDVESEAPVSTSSSSSISLSELELITRTFSPASSSLLSLGLEPPPAVALDLFLETLADEVSLSVTISTVP